MNKNLLVLALLGLSMSMVVARHRDVFTNGSKGDIAVEKQQAKDDARLQKEQDDAEKKAARDARQEERSNQRAADRAAKDKEKADKAAAKEMATLTPDQHAKKAQMHTQKAKKVAAQVQDVMEGLEDLKTQKATLVSNHKDKVANTSDEVKQAHLLKVRYASKAGRKAAAQQSCQAHGTCHTAQVQDVMDNIVAQRATLTDLNAQHEDAKNKARHHHARAGTSDEYDQMIISDVAKAQVAGDKETKGAHRFSNAQQDVATARTGMKRKTKKVVNAAELQAKVRRIETLIAQAKQEKAVYLANFEKKQKAQRLAQAKQPRKWKAPQLSPVV